MLLFMMLIGFVSDAKAQPGFELISGESILEECATAGACGDYSMDSIGNLMTKQGFALQHMPFVGSAIRSQDRGPAAGLSFDALTDPSTDGDVPDAFPFAPRIAVGAIHHEAMEERRPARLGVGAYLIPPLRITGISILSTGVNASYLQPLRGGKIGLGGSVTYSMTSVSGAFIEGPAALEAMGALPPNFGGLADDSACSEDPCADKLVLQSLAPSLAATIEPAEVLSIHMQGGVAWFQHQITLGFEDATWQQLGGHPTLQAGATLRPTSGLQLGFTYAALLQLGNTRDPVLHKLQGALSVHWLARRPPPSREADTTNVTPAP